MLITTGIFAQTDNNIMSLPTNNSAPFIRNLNNGNVQSPDVNLWAINGASTSGNVRGPVSSFTYQRSLYFISAAEMIAAGFPSGINFTTIGFSISTASLVSVSGNLKIYLQNANVTSFTKSTNWTTAVVDSMTLVNDGVLAGFNTTAAPYDVTLTNPTAFTYSGNGIWVAMEYQLTTAVSTGMAQFCTTVITNSLRSYQSNTSMSTTLGALSAFRPSTRFSYSWMNDLSVALIYTMGKNPVVYGFPHQVRALVQNASDTTLTDRMVYLNVTGANSFKDSLLVSSISPGSTQSVTFTSYTSSNVGNDSINVYVGPDNNNANNSKTQVQQVNTNTFSYSYKETADGGVGFTGNTGDFVAKFYTSSPSNINQIQVNFSTGGVTNLAVGIWDDNAGVPGTNLYTSSQFTSTAGAYTIIVNPPVNVTGNFYVGVRQNGTVNASFSFQTEAPIRSQTFFYTSPVGGTTWTDFSATGSNFRFMIEPRLQLANDVGVQSVGSTGSKIYSSLTVNPTGIVANYGANTNTFVVTRKIEPGGYVSTKTVTSLAGNATSNVTFDSWAYTSGNTYTVKDSTYLASDLNASNDTLSGSITPILDNTGPAISYTPFTSTTSTANRTLSGVSVIDQSPIDSVTLKRPRCYFKRNTDANTFEDNTSTTDGWKFVEADGTGGTSPFSFTLDYTLLNTGSGVAVGDVIEYFFIFQDVIPNISYKKGTLVAPPTKIALESTDFPITGLVDSYHITSTSALSGNYLIGLSLFNKVTGKNITFEKRTVREPVSVSSKSDAGSIVGNNNNVRGADISTTPPFYNGSKDMGSALSNEVEREYFVPFENGIPYIGKLFLNIPDGPDAGQYYATLTQAVNDLNTSGVSGPVNFLLTDALYNNEDLPIAIHNVAGTSDVNTVTIKPNTGINSEISGSSSANSIIKVFNSNYIIIDGSNTIGGTTRNLTLTNTTATAPSVVWFGSSGTTPVTNLTLKNCILNNGTQLSSAVFVSDGTTSGSPGYFSNITIQNNSINKAYIGVYANGGTSPQNGSNLTLSDNTITSSGVNSLAYIGLYMQGVSGATVSGNEIANFSSTDAQNDEGIWLATGTINATVEKNKIYALGYSGFDGYGAHGIRMSTGQLNANILVKNNVIYNITGDGWSYTSAVGDNPLGIYLSSTQTGISLFNNSISLYGNTLNQTDAVSIGICLGIGSVADIRNNAVVNKLGRLASLGLGACGIYAQTDNTQFTDINYNDYFINSTGSGINAIGKLSTTTTAVTLSGWKTATGKDINSVSADPGFTSDSNLQPDVNNTNCWNINSGAYPSASVSTDFLGNPRSTTLEGGASDIGAYEFTPTSPAAPVTVGGTIINGGTSTIIYGGEIIASITWSSLLEATLPDNITVTYKPGVSPSNTPIGSKFANETIEITATGGSGYTYDLTFKYNLSRQGTITSEANFRLAKYDGATWFQYPALPNQVDKTITVTGLNSFSVFSFGDNDFPLPVQLASFTSSVNNRDVKLDWKTESEINNAGFDIERCVFGSNQWLKAGYIAGKGNSNSPVNYTFEDKKLNSGKYNYRLKQIDNNGNFEYFALSNAVEVGLPTKFELSQNYPNPFNPVTKIDFSLPLDAKVSIKLYDITGREVKTLVNESRTAGYYTVQFNASDLSSGTYFYRIMTKSSSADYIMTKKMVLVK